MPEAEGEESSAEGSTFWSGTISFGLVSVPVNLLAANRSQRTSLRMVTEEGTRLSRRYFTAADLKPLDSDQIVRGYELEKDQFVVVEDEELEKLAPERTRDIDLRVFVDTRELDPIYFERAYYLTPAGNSTKAYRLLARVMEETGKAGIATFVMRAKEYLIAIIAENGIIRAETLRFGEEVRTPEMVGLPEPTDVKPMDVKRLEKSIEKLAQKKFDPSELKDGSAERLMKLVEKKLGSGKDVVKAQDEDDEPSDVIDLMEMLQRSLAVRDSDGDEDSAPSRPAKKPGSSGRSSSKSTATKSKPAGARKSQLQAKSKAELYRQATELEIEGRSGMSKEQLIEAIQRSA